MCADADAVVALSKGRVSCVIVYVTVCDVPLWANVDLNEFGPLNSFVLVNIYVCD